MFHDTRIDYFLNCLHNPHISIQSLDSNLHDKNLCVNLSIYCNLFYNNFFGLSFLVTIFTIIVFLCRIKEIILNNNRFMQSFSMNLQITFEMYLAITIFAFKSLVTSLYLHFESAVFSSSMLLLTMLFTSNFLCPYSCTQLAFISDLPENWFYKTFHIMSSIYKMSPNPIVKFHCELSTCF